jgi:hypothetical protein
MLITPLSAPIILGVKVTVIVQVAPAARGDEETQLSVSEKSPPVFKLKMLIGELPEFVNVNCCVLVVPIF